ncbi:MAG: hypothetical protein Tsb0015_15710 [Simkaniaceae bacterium]
MKIKIADRFRPFSHRAGTCALVPNTDVIARVYPVLLHLQSLSSGQIWEAKLALKGPVKGFTVMQDLEKGFLTVFGETGAGFFRYRLFGEKEKLYVSLDRGLKEGLAYESTERSGKFLLKKRRELLPCRTHFTPSIPRLSLGNQKKQDIEAISKRLDLTEIFPLVYRIGQMIPEMPAESPAAPAATSWDLLKSFEKALQGKDRAAQLFAFHKFYQVAVKDLFVPRLFDEEYRGIVSPPKGNPNLYNLKLLQESARLIENCFFQQSKAKLFFLPSLPAKVHSGRLLQICGEDNKFSLDFTWRSNALRQVIIRANSNAEFQLAFPSAIRNYRVRLSKRHQGYRKAAGELFSMKAGTTYFLDNFQK